MKPFLSIAVLSLVLAACVDTTGLSAETSRGVHPGTNANAVVTVLEYGDLQCPACKAAQTMLAAPMVQKYGAQIRFEFRQFPLSSIHPYALPAAEASECAADQGKFWEFIDLAYEKQDELNPAALDAWGEELGLDMDLYNRCRDSHIKRDLILAEYSEGRDEMDVTGTPTFFVNGVKVTSTTEALNAAIEQGLANAGKNL